MSHSKAEIIFHAEADETIEHFCSRLIFLTWTYGFEVSGRFNDLWLHCRRGMSHEDVMEPFTRQSFDSYFGEGAYDRRRVNGRGSG